MHKVENCNLSQDINDKLQVYQADVLKKDIFEEQKKEADRLWKKHNKKENQDFSVVRVTLKKMAPKRGFCIYCETNTQNQIDHFRPKACYPEDVFKWENFLPACGVCNLAKHDKFWVYQSGTPRWCRILKTGEQPERHTGTPALLNPRFEDSMALLGLELGGTFLYYARYPKGTIEYDRAECTVKTLGLNNDVFASARAGAYDAYCSHLESYAIAKSDGKAQLKRKAILKIAHATVWWEMKRQAVNGHRILNRLFFQQVPEAMQWSHEWTSDHDHDCLREQASNTSKYLLS